MPISNPTGISTSQGRGQAQVFGDTYNSFFKDKLETAKAKDKEVTDAMAKLSEPGQLWSRDVGAFKPKLDNLRQFYRDNARDIIKGDFDTTLKLKQLQNDASQYITSSKSTEKYANDLLKAIQLNPKKYSDASKQQILDFANQRQAGDFDVSKLRLDPKYNVGDSIKSLQDSVGKLGYDLSKLTTETLKDGTTILVDEKGQNVGAIEDLIAVQKESDKGMYGDDQVNAEWTDDFMKSTVNSLRSFIDDKRTSKIVPDYSPYSSRTGKEQLLGASKIKDHIWHLQNYIPGRTEQELDLWKNVNIPSLGGVIKGVQHSNSDEKLKNQYKQGALIMDIATNPGTAQEKLVKKVIPLGGDNSWSELYGLVSSTGKFDKVNVDAFDQIPAYEPTAYEKGYVKPKAENVDDFKDSMINFFKDPLIGFLDKGKIGQRGYNNEFSALLSQARGKKPIDVVSNYLVGKKTESGKVIKEFSYDEDKKAYTVSYKDGTETSFNKNDETAIRDIIAYPIEGKSKILVEEEKKEVPSSGKKLPKLTF